MNPPHAVYKAILRTVLIFGATLALCIGALAFIGRPERWPPPEQPPRQGEAMDAVPGAPPGHASAALGRLVREPQNTWSNVAFVLGGAVLIAVGINRNARMIGVVLIAVGIGSFLYHASASRTLRHLDVGAMNWLFLVAALFSVSSHWPALRKHGDRFTGTILIVTLVLAVVATAGRNWRVLNFKPLALSNTTATAATIMITSLILVAWHRRSWSTTVGLAGIVTLFAVALTCQIGDRPGGWLCDPNAIVQAHALWHIFSAAAFVLAVRELDQHATRVLDHEN